MAVVAESDFGWFVDHQLSIDDTYKCTEVTRSKGDIITREEREFFQQRREMTQSGKEPDLANYRCKPDLFAIWQPFVMDSHFNRALEMQNTVFYYNGKTIEKDTNCFLERNETSAELESSTSTVYHAYHEKNSQKVPAALLASPDSYNEQHIPLSMQKKVGKNCYNRKVGNSNFVWNTVKHR